MADQPVQPYPAVMKPKGSLLSSQKTAIVSLSDEAELSPYFHILISGYILILSSHLRFDLSSSST
jgi:hypothetical protein